jgi:hypothetical protein
MRGKQLPEVAGHGREACEPPQVLRGSCKQHFVPDAAQAPQPKPVEPENSLHMRKSHFDLLALAARLLEGFRIGQPSLQFGYVALS